MTIHVFSALVVAAGQGTRMIGSCTPKQYEKIKGNALLCHTLENAVSPFGCPITVVINKEHDVLYHNTTLSLSSRTKGYLTPPVYGGHRRQDSVRIGLQSLKGINPEYVIIHDACRPFVEPFPLDKALSHMGNCVGLVPVLPLPETVSVVKNNIIVDAVDRACTYIVQTPQIFRYKEILECHERVYKLSPEALFTDDSSVALHCNYNVATMSGSANNFKITTPQDMIRAASLL